MHNESSASNMILKEMSHDSHEVTHDLEQSSQISSPRKVMIRAKKSRREIHHMEEKDPQSANETFLTSNKENRSYFGIQSKEVSNEHLHTISDEKNTHVKIENYTCIQRSQKSHKTKKRSVILLQSIFSQEPYVKRLMTYLPTGNFCSMNILRQKKMFFTNFVMTIKGEEMIKAKKIGGCFSGGYEIVSENQRENTLGYLNSNLSGSLFNVWQLNDLNERKLVSTIWYEDSFNFKSAPRSVEMYILSPQSPQDLNHSHEFHNLKEMYERGDERKVFKLTNRQAQVRNSNQYVMDFGVDHVLPSVKNVVLENQTGDVAIIFCKTNQDLFELKIRQNVSAFLGYCFALSSLTFKLACQ